MIHFNAMHVSLDALYSSHLYSCLVLSGPATCIVVLTEKKKLHHSFTYNAPLKTLTIS